MRKELPLVMFLLAFAVALAVRASATAPPPAPTLGANAVDSTTVVATLPFDSAQQVYVFTYGYAVCNGSLAIISCCNGRLETPASKLIYLPKHNALIFLNASGLYKVALSTLEVVRLYADTLDDFWVAVGQGLIYAWRNASLLVIDLSGLVKASTTYAWPIKYVVPYAWDYWLLVATSNGTSWDDYIYSDAKKLTLNYIRHRAVTSDAFFVDWGGDKTLVFANTTHLIYWRTYADSVTVHELPVALSAISTFHAITYWSYAVVVADGNDVVLYARDTFFTYTFSGGVSYAKVYVGMRTWGSDWPWLVVASADGLRLVYIDPNTNDWTAQTIYSGGINSDVFIDDIDFDGAEEFYFVAQGELIRVEIEQVQYAYAYRATIPSMFFWAGKFLVYDRSASDWDGDGLRNDREVNELQTSLLRADTDGDGLSDYEEVYTTGTNPLKLDTDGDGIPDGEENVTSPVKADTDGDGIPDGEELVIGTNPLDPDTDKDGLTDGDEREIGTNPLKPDTDSDGLPDGEEAKYGTDPTKKDTDGDKLTDYEEANTFYTDPTDPDTDNDGLTDYEEVKVYGTNPLKADTDGDGVLDGTEAELGFDPLDPRNSPKSAWYVVTTFWWAFAFTLMMGVGFGMIGTLLLAYAVKRKAGRR